MLSSHFLPIIAGTLFDVPQLRIENVTTRTISISLLVSLTPSHNAIITTLKKQQLI